MPDVEQLHLEDALEDSPQTHHLLTVFEKDAMMLKKFTQNMHNSCQRIMSAQNELCAATQALAQHLRAYESHKFPLESEDSVLSSTLQQFSTYLDDISSVQQVLAQQFSETMMYPLSKFLQADIEEISTMFEMFQVATRDHEQSLAKYMKQPMKKDDKSRIEVNEELYANRKKFHQTALHYYSSLNALQYKRKCFLLEPVMGYLHAQRACFQMGQDIILRADIEDFLGNIGSSVQSVHADMAKETQKTVEVIDSIEQQSQHMYHAEPPIDMPFIPPNTSLTQKAGYLYCRGKQVLLSTKWDRIYFFTQGGNLMSQVKEEFAGSLVMDLNEEGVLVESCVADERRHTFQVVAPQAKKTVVLQAENYRERDEWIATLNNIIRDGGYVRGRPASIKKKDAPRRLSNSQSQENASSLQSSVASSQGGAPSITATNLTAPFNLDIPIQFDLVLPSEESRAATSPQSGQPKRLNPFDQSSAVVLNPAFDSAAFSESFTTRFLGSMEVKGDRGEQLVHATIRQIMAARAIHNIFKMTESLMIVSSEGMRLIDPSNNTVRIEFALQDISFWSSHPDNNRLFGFITRNRIAPSPPNANNLPEGGKSQNSNPTFACHVFESNTTAEDICQAISTATKVAYQALMEKRKGAASTTTTAAAAVPKAKAQVNEKNLLLKNIHNFPEDIENNKKFPDDEIHDDDDDNPNTRLPISPDGKFLILTAIDEPITPSPVATPTSPVQVEDSTGAEGGDSESEA